MRTLALEEAQERLDRAQLAAKRMQQAKSDKDARIAWSEFLNAAGTFFSKLEQGSKGNGASESWYGSKKPQRKEDEILVYVHQARNADEHGLSRVSRNWKQQQIVGGSGVRFAVPDGDGEISEFNLIYNDGSQKPAETIVSDVLRLEPVSNRGRVYEPPIFFSEPMNATLGGRMNWIMTPSDVADRTLANLELILAEAKALKSST
jgi:hypothetical protein